MSLVPPQPLPYVDSATIKDKMIELSINVDDFDAGIYVEISGNATQTGGAFANFYDIRQVPTAPNDPDDPSSPHRYVFVSAHPLPPNNFREDQDVAVIIRLGRVWLTVLGKGQATQPEVAQPAGENTKWDQVRKVSQITGDSPNQAAAS
jgi:hypothetical protein